MILEKETYEKFGYYPRDLSYGSSKKILAKCDGCGKVRILFFKLYRSLCPSCAQKGKCHSIYVNGEKHGNWKGGKNSFKCEWCGKSFKAYSSNRRKKHVFCSIKCKSSWYSKTFRGKNSQAWKGGKIKRICRYCGNSFTVFIGEIKKGNGNYCSRLCTLKAAKHPTHHTKPELIFEGICKKYNLPFKYTGDGAFWIGKDKQLNPDFIEADGKKIIIEIYGDYWHSPLLRPTMKKIQHPIYRKQHYKRFKWILVSFWESDLKRKDAEQFVLKELQKIGKIRLDMIC